jgi:hypothetical protein
MGTGDLESSTGEQVSRMLCDDVRAIAKKTDLTRIARLEEAGSAVENWLSRQQSFW